jgi:hypothetical protein
VVRQKLAAHVDRITVTPHLGGVYRYQPQGMTGHPECGQMVQVTGLIIDPQAGMRKIRTLGAGGQCESPAEMLERDYYGPLDGDVE